MENRPSLPLFYEKPVALNSETHAATTIARSPRGFAFAASAHSVVLAGVEFSDACRFFPILFGSSEEGAVIPVALMGLRVGDNLFVGPNGEWRADYIPAYIRRYPFITTTKDDTGLTVCIDEAFDGLNVEGGEALFAGGEPSQHLSKMLGFLNDFVKQMSATETVCSQIRESGLLKPMALNIQLNNGSTLNLTDFHVIDEQKLAELGNDLLDELFRSGALAMIYAHLISLRGMAALVNRTSERAARAE